MTGFPVSGRLTTEDGNVMNTPIAPLRYLSRTLLATTAVVSVVVLTLALVVSAAGSARAQSGSLDGDSLGAQGEPHLYLAQQGEDRIAAVPLGGGPVSTVDTVVDGLESPQGVTVADGTVFISERSPHRVVSVPTGGGEPTELAADLNSPRGLLVVGDRLFIADSANDRVISVPVTGGEVSIVADEDDGLDSPRDLAIDGDTLFIADRQHNRVLTVPVDGGSVTELVTFDSEVGYLEVSDGLLYISDREDTVWSVPVTGGTPTVLTTGLDSVSGLAVSGDSLLISERGEGRVLAQPLSGGDPETLLEMDHVYDIAVGPGPCTGSACLPVVGSLFGSLG